jgi:RNA polymerase sigma-70 factor (family 1)
MQNKERTDDFLEISSIQAHSDAQQENDSDRPTDKEFFIRSVFQTDVKKGYDLLFRHYYAPLCNHAVRYVYSREIAEDIVSEVFLSFWKKSVHEHISISFRSYLFISVRNRCFSYLKRELEKGEAEELDDRDPAAVYTQPDRLMEFDELYQKIEKIIAGFPPQNQKVFLMSRFEGKSHQEISEKLRISKKAVEAHISKALVAFRKVLRSNNMILIAGFFKMALTQNI